MTNSDKDKQAKQGLAVLLGALGRPAPKDASVKKTLGTQEHPETAQQTAHSSTAAPVKHHSVADKTVKGTPKGLQAPAAEYDRPAMPTVPFEKTIRHAHYVTPVAKVEPGVTEATRPTYQDLKRQLTLLEEEYDGLRKVHRAVQDHVRKMALDNHDLQTRVGVLERAIQERDVKMINMITADEAEERISYALQEERRRYQTLEGFFNAHIGDPNLIEQHLDTLVREGVITDRERYIEMICNYAKGAEGKE